jgi:tetratricopeptide (TPR) repeat protein
MKNRNYKMLNFKNFRLLILLFMVTLVALPTYGQKKKKEEEQTRAKKAYNDLTHKYNAYFNADLKMQAVIKTLEKQHQENYNQVLPMYRFLAVEGSTSPAADLDIIIKKSGVAISLHRMSHWTDDSYLLIGQSQFLKGEFQNAEGTFKYIISELDPKKMEEKLAKKKGKKKKKGSTKKKSEPKKNKNSQGLTKVNRPKDKFGNPIEPKEEDKVKEIIEEIPTKDEAKKYFLKHRPSHKEAMLWLAKTQIAMEHYDEAFIGLNRLRRDNTLPQSLRAEIEATEAFIYLKLKEYDKAVAPLMKAVALSKDRKQKIRYTYILGQLHQMAGRGQEAYATYEQVLKLRPIYEMEFNARLSIAQNSYENGDGSMDNAIRDLEKMLKDEKNEEYLDQIYFAMAEIELKRDNRNLAIYHLKKSVYNNVNNKAQKSEAYYLLADLYYQDEVYTKSKYYYDSTVTVMGKTDDRYLKAQSRSISLKEIAANIEIIELQDSLIRIMAMSDVERMALALKIREAEEKAKAAAAKGKSTVGGRRPTVASQPAAKAGGGRNEGAANIGTWWAYDADAVRKGKRDFEKEWGTRILSDNWRRSNRKNTGIAGTEIEETGSTFKELTSTEVDDIFAKMGVPKTDGELKNANEKISDAMASLGPLYRDRLKNNEKAIDILELLMTRYPDNKYKMESAYLLYVMYNEKPDFVKANKYKDMILNIDKESKFAKAIIDPKFLEKENLKQVRIADYYDNAYSLFEKGNVELALEKVDEVDNLFKPEENMMKPKFALLAAMCEGSLNGKDAYKVALNDVVKTYPKTDESVKAQQILNYLGNDGTAAAKPSTEPEVDGMFLQEDGVHFFIAKYDPDILSRNDITAKFSDYNKEFHSLERLRVTSIYLDLKTPLLVIKRFDNKAEAMVYYNTVMNGSIEKVMGNSLESFKIIPMVISQDNYKVIVRKKVLDEYLTFFEDTYK